jgi:hypothetical protein
VVRLEVVDDKILERAPLQDGIDACEVIVVRAILKCIHEGRVLICDQVCIVGNSIREWPVVFEKVFFTVVGADIMDLI